MRIAYVLSKTFDYDRLIAGDAGSAFAEDYDLPVISLDRLAAERYDMAVIDQRFQPDELPTLRAAISDNRHATFVLRVCDPFWEHTQNHWWYRFVLEMLDTPRVHVMLNYQPSEITALMATRARRSQYVFAPYVYRPEKEVGVDHQKRSHRVLFSGALNSALYPLRTQMQRIASAWPPLRAMSNTLRHPGYTDIGQTQRHECIGDSYIAELAKFRFAAVCSSRCRLEFLKYREFAYAGVLPVGDMPATLLDCPPDSWVPWRRNFVALTRAIKMMSDTAARAERFRRFMQNRRNVQEMRARVREQFARLG